jgi:hypothetical protein
MDGVRAYFCARAWTPFRLPVFMLGMVMAGKRLRAQRTGESKQPEYIKVGRCKLKL